MRKLIILTTLFLMLSINSVYSQGVGINTDGSSPHGSAILDVKSTTQGFLFPRMTAVQMNAIPAPSAGLQIYNTTCKLMYFYNGTNWLDMSFKDCPATATDIDGNVYNVVKIGCQCWFQTDLKVSTYPNGDAIPYIDNNATWAALADNNTSDAYTVYGDNDNNGIVASSGDYGYLYSYAAAIGDNWARDNNANQGVCPDGWHLPTDSEWLTLENEVETGVTITAGAVGSRGTDVGERLKEDGTTHWNTDAGPNGNSSNFIALPSGYRSHNDGSSSYMGDFDYWWSAAEYSSSYAWYRRLFHSVATSYRGYTNKSFGFPVRCIRD